MKKIGILVLLIFFFERCYDSSSNPNIDDVNKEASKEDVLVAISSYRESLYGLGATSSGSVGRVSARSEGTSVTIHSKDKIIDSNMTGHDEEWLDISLHVLSFAEALTSSDYILGELTLFNDVLNDPSFWAWGANENTKVILSYIEEVLYLRVIDESLVQTFFFEYVQDDLIKIFRLYEEDNSTGNSLYIEDFVENTGLTIWRSDETYVSSVTFEDGFRCFIRSTLPGQKTFHSAYYSINGVPLTIYEDNWIRFVEYDFKFVNVFDSFDEEGTLYLSDEVVQMPIEMKVRELRRNDETVYTVTGVKALDEQMNSMIGVSEANILTDMTFQDITSRIEDAFFSPVTNGISSDYSKGKDFVYDDLADLLYLDYE